jgi:hypothetical protein
VFFTLTYYYVAVLFSLLLQLPVYNCRSPATSEWETVRLAYSQNSKLQYAATGAYILSSFLTCSLGARPRPRRQAAGETPPVFSLSPPILQGAAQRIYFLYCLAFTIGSSEMPLVCSWGVLYLLQDCNNLVQIGLSRSLDNILYPRLNSSFS